MNRLLTRISDWALCQLGFIGDLSRLTLDASQVDLLAVPLNKEATHTGVVYRTAASELRFLHYPYHDQALRNDRCSGQFAYAVPLLKEEDLLFMAEFCARVHRANQARKLPYSFEFDPNIGFDRNTGLVSLNQNSGLSCSTFVVALFRSAGNPLVQPITWPRQASSDDITTRRAMLEMWRNSGKPILVARADQLEQTIQTMRISPVQVAGACLQTHLPTGYYRATQNGKRILQRITAYFGPATH